MRGYMFRNRWLAMLFVGMILAGVTRLVGTETDKGAIDAAATEIVKQKAQADQFAADMSEAETPADDISVEFTSDEELIDAAVGEDPTPVDEFAEQQAAENPPASEVALVNPVTAEQSAPPQ